MKTRRDGRIVLVENPLTGNDSTGRALGLSDGEKTAKWFTPQLVRKEVGEAKWRAATKMVLVREPVARFLSGATLALNSSEEQLLTHGASPEVAARFDELSREQVTSAVLLLAFINAVRVVVNRDGWDSLPIYLRPQSMWLKAKFDIVLATHNIAEYFNTDGKRCCIGSNRLHRNPSIPVQVALTPNTEAIIKTLYADDVKTFDRLLVWSPRPERVRLVNGYCATCEARKNRGEFEPIDLRSFDEGDAVEQAPAQQEVAQVKRKPARQKRSRRP